MNLSNLKIGDQLLYLFPKSNPLSSVIGIFIGHTDRGSIEMEWFDKKKRYWYTAIDQENLVNIKKVIKSKTKYIPKRLFQKFNIHDEEHLKEPTMQIIKRIIKDDLRKHKEVHRQERRTAIAVATKNTINDVEQQLKSSKRNSV